MKWNCLSSKTGPLQLVQGTLISSWLFPAQVLLGIFLLLSSSSIPACQGSSSLAVRRNTREISKREPYQVFQASPSFLYQDQEDSLPASHSIHKRDVSSASSSSNSSSNSTSFKVKRWPVHLNDSHNQLLVFWAGEDVILCLAKDVNSNTSSTLWVSRDYGGSFTNATSLLVQNQSGGSAAGTTPSTPLLPVLEGFFNHPSQNGHFAFTDITNKVIYTTRNYGAEFTANKIDFVPDEVLFDPHSDRNIVAYEKSTKEKQMWVSINFGKTWIKVQDHVKTLAWDETVTPSVLYLQREQPDGTTATTTGDGGTSEEIVRTVILKSNSLFLDDKDTEVIIAGVEEFEIKDEFMFATKPKENGLYDLLISYKNSKFRKAIFPSSQATKHFFIADVSTDGQIFVCVVQNGSVSNLYIGSFPMAEDEDPKFSLSLERILYFKPNVTWAESWLNEVASEPFVDLHHVEGLRGVYIASQLKQSTVTNGKFNMNEVISLITYDQGGEWNVLNPPEFEHDGRPIYCQYSGGGNCSLHISQRLSELYPRTRAVPILSKKSAVGMVLATGTVNTTLKGRLGVYLSTDGAVSWRQLLQGNYLYAFGDHGGIIVATKMYQIGGDTNELLYSIDEGVTWETYEFYEEKVRIMGLMTEPGENTTTFFIFGSLASGKTSNARHTWVLIKVDFRDVFGRVCEKADYKMWSPWDAEEGKIPRPCLMGRKEIYERRIPTSKCYNGKDYVRPVTNETCPCKRRDFECDFGYILDSHHQTPGGDRDCIKDNTESSPGVKPEWCRPSDHDGSLPSYYNKTKGYRKIPGDTCIEGTWVEKYLPEQIPCEVKEEPEFMLVAKRDSVLRVDLNHYERVETLPLTRVQAAIAVDFNLKNNCIFWSDVQHKTIMKLHLDGKSAPEKLVSSDLTSVEGLAFDWMSNNLYFTDGGGSKIEVVRVDNHRMRKRLLTKPNVEKPRGLAVHPEKGFIFWTDWSTQNPCIGRSHLDGSNPQKIIVNKQSPNGQPLPASQLTVKWPNGITIDFQRNRLFWVDANLDRMLTSDLNGGDIQIVLERNSRISHPFAVAVYKTSVYWDDWTTRGIYSAPLDKLGAKEDNFTANTDQIYKIKGDLPRLMDLKVYGTGMQQGHNLCSSPQTSNCSQLCFAGGAGNETQVSCQCPDGFVMQNGSCVCPDGKAPKNGTFCESKCDNGTGTFKCRTHENFCIITAWRCDGENDCGDWSDEENCDTQVCTDPNEFKCKISGRCIPNSFKCDYDHDCGPGDTSDEEDCKSKGECDPEKNFECGNGRCILKNWRCDEDDDCLDGSDEKNCTDFGKNGTALTCLQNEYKCPNENKCLSMDWICDFDNDCQDGSDEVNCTGKTCPDWKFSCNQTGHCIMKTWECDGDKDCPDGSDEHEGCPPATTLIPLTPENPFAPGNCSQMSQMFECLGSKECIPIYWKCDHVKDCQDGSDELGCSTDGDDEGHSVTVAPPPSKCEMDQWRCNDGGCIASYAVCDGFPDCLGREDEHNCHNVTGGGCPLGMKKCGPSKVCIPQGKWCDGKVDCPNKADEDKEECAKEPPKFEEVCNSGSFKCDDGSVCVPLFRKCDKREDCYDGTDEDHEVCESPLFQRVHQVEGLSVSEIDSTWFHVEWWLPAQPSGKKLEFIPSVCEIAAKHCWNASSTKGRDYKFEDLHPYNKYSVTIYVKDGQKVFPPYLYHNVTTREDVASAPFGVTVTQNSTEDLIISWKKPHSPNGKIRGYKVYFQPPMPPAEIDADKEILIISNKQSDPVFLAGENYTFWVTAVNGMGEGKKSDLVTYVYNGEVAFITTLNVKGATENTVKFSWEPSNDHVDSYLLLLQTDVAGSVYSFRNQTETKKKLIDYEHLAPGTRYKLTIIPKFKGMHGTIRTASFTTKGATLPIVQDFKLVSSASNGNVKLSWRPVKISGSSYNYGIYYGKSVQEIAQRRARILTNQTQAEAQDLEACENYLFDIGLVSIPGGMPVGPLTERPLQVVTKMNPSSPPKSVQVETRNLTEEDYTKIRVTWRSPCDAMDTKIGYNITITETTNDNSYGVSNVSYSHDPELSHNLIIHYGGHYQLVVSTSVPEGRPSAPVYFDGPPIPFPDQINECAKCNPLTIYWNTPKLPLSVTKKGQESYIVWLSKDANFTNPRRYETRESNFRFEDVPVDNGIYYAAVSVKDHDGLESPKSSPIFIQHLDGSSSPIVLPGTSALAITITVLVIIVLLVSVLAVFVVRHKRLQTSFLNFASSHYSSSSGAATFQQTMEDADSPVIRGFSDDEPLLVA